MYAPGTILKLRVPRPDIKGLDDEEYPFPYNEVRVIGVSPLNHATMDSEWVGQQGSGVIIEPLSSFGSTLDEPFGKLQALYEVVSIPEPLEIDSKVRVIQPGEAGPSPEDKFAAEQKEAGIEKSATRMPTPVSPLDDDPEAAERAKLKEAAKEHLVASTKSE